MFAGVVFEMGAVTVDPMTPTFNPAPLIPYLAELGVPYFFERQGILKKAEQMEEVASICRSVSCHIPPSVFIELDKYT